MFFKVEYSTIERVLDIKPEGKKLKLTKKIKELRAKFEKEGKITYQDNGLLDEDLPDINLKFVKSHSVAHKQPDF